MMLKQKNALIAFMLGIATCCATIACVFLGGKISVRADSLQKNTADLFSYSDVEGLSVTPATVLYDDVKGLKVAGDGSGRQNMHWYYTVNGTFYGNSSIEYVFSTASTNVSEATSFVYTDVSGNRLFTVLIAPGAYDTRDGLYGGVYAEKDRTGKTFDVHTVTEDGTKTDVQITAVFESMADNRKAFTNLGDGFLPVAAAKQAIRLDFGDTALSVCMLGADKKMVEIVAFGYDEYPEMKTMEQRGYKLRIADGDDYGVTNSRAWSLLANSGSAIPSVISLNGLALDKENVSVSETYSDIIYSEGETSDGTKTVISLREGGMLGAFSYSSFLGIKSETYGELRFPEVYKSGVLNYPQGAKYSEKACGEYSLDVSYGEIVKEYTLVIGREFSDLLDLGNDGSIVVTPAVKLGAYTGALLATNTRQWIYGINGTMYGDSRIEYTFTTQLIEATSFVYYGADGKRVFTAFLVPSTDRANGCYFGGVYLETAYQNRTASTYTFENSEYAEMYGETVQTSVYEIHTLTNTREKTTAQFIKNSGDPSFLAGVADRGNRKALESAAVEGVLPAYNGKFAISLIFGENALSVQMDDKNGSAVEIVSLPYAEYPEAQSMKEGYTLKIGTGAGEERDWALIQNEQGNIPSLISINGTNLDDVYPEITYTDWSIINKNEKVEGTDNVIEIDETDELAAFYVTAKYSFGGIYLDEVVNRLMYSDESFGDKEPGEYEYFFVYGGKNNGICKRYIIRVNPAVPQLVLKKELNGYETIIKDLSQTLTVSPDDVIAEDKIDGTLTDIQIEIKTPGQTDFIPYTDSFSLGEFGVYTIRYIATNSNNRVGTLERTVRYMPSRPQIELSGEIPSVAYLGKRVVLPAAGSGITLSVFSEGESIEIVDGGFTPSKTGTYEITYSYTDEYGITAVKQAEIVVLSDVTSPVITVENNSVEYKVGDKIIAPNASATDDADGKALVSVAIYFDGEKVGDNEVVAANVGFYTIVYTATDESGNTSRKDVKVFVYSPDGEAFSSAEKKSGCGSSIVGAASATLLFAGVIAVSLFIKKRKND